MLELIVYKIHLNQRIQASAPLKQKPFGHLSVPTIFFLSNERQQKKRTTSKTSKS